MIVREILVTRKLGVKHTAEPHFTSGTPERGFVPEWYGGHPVFPVTALNTVIQRQPGFIGENYDYMVGTTAVGGILTGDPAGQITAAFSGEYDWKDFLYFSQPVVTTSSEVESVSEGADGNYYYVPRRKPIGLAMHSSKIRPTEFGLPDSKDFITVLFFPCTVTIAMDASERKMFNNNNVIEITLSQGGPTYVRFVYDENLRVFKIVSTLDFTKAVGAILAGDDTAGIYTIEFWG
jgi:hypothetical protein